MMRIFTLLLSILLTACTGIPEGIEPVQDFKLERYLGTWYEIARLDHSFERDLTRVTATYRLRNEANKEEGLSVINKGFNQVKGEWKTANGKAFFVGDETTAHLKVSFFGPFYGSYIVFHLDDDYQYAYVTSSSRDYLWLLAREKSVPPCVKAVFEEKAEELGFNLEELEYIAH